MGKFTIPETVVRMLAAVKTPVDKKLAALLLMGVAVELNIAKKLIA